MRISLLNTPLRALCLLPALALGACDPKLTLGEVLDADEPADDASTGQDASADSGEADSNDPAPNEDASTSDGDDSTGAPADDSGEPVTGCDPWAQDCPAAQKCAATASDGASTWDTLQCVPLDPMPVPVGDACQVVGDALSGVDNCELGSMCWDPDPNTGIGTCVAQCTGSEEEPVCAEGHQCLISNGGVLPLCLSECHPLIQDCSATDLCVDTGSGFVCVTDASGDEGQIYDSCEYINVCDKGLACVASTLAAECDPLNNACCLPFCDVTAENSCTGEGQECLPWAEMPPAATANVGLCALPG